jgi:C4-dicarboxylate-binding protein DctP
MEARIGKDLIDAINQTTSRTMAPMTAKAW